MSEAVTLNDRSDEAKPSFAARALVAVAWVAVFGLVAAVAVRLHNRAISDYALLLLVPMFWLIVPLGLIAALRRRSIAEPVGGRVETIFLGLAAIVLVVSTIWHLFTAPPILWFAAGPYLPVNIFHVGQVMSALCVAGLVTVIGRFEMPHLFEAAAMPLLAFLLPFVLTTVEMGNGSAIKIAGYASAATALVSVIAWAATRDRVHAATLGGILGMVVAPVAAGIAAAIALIAPATRWRNHVYDGFALGAGRVAVFAAGLVLAGTFSKYALGDISPTLRSVIERAEAVLAMRPLIGILASCAVLFAL